MAKDPDSEGSASRHNLPVIDLTGEYASKQIKRRAFVPIKDVPIGFVSKITPTLEQEVHSISGGQKLQGQIVLIHGALASRRYLLPTAKLLAKQIQVYVPEMPGHGASSRPLNALTVPEHADVLAEWFRKNDITKAHVFANSYGCQVAAQLTATYPDLVDRLILSGPTTDPTAHTVIQQGWRLFIDGFYEPKGAQGQLYDDLSDMSIKIALETANRMVQNDICINLAKIASRTLVLRGEHDTIAPRGWTQDVARRISNASFDEIPKAPHCVNFANPTELTEMIMTFINAE